ncbi:MAG TPA: methyltransferase domain-containing protein [Kofleriaceae bacterium]|nr:methyltransferase domain-containing protein [Kofleriaceae bacterium]
MTPAAIAELVVCPGCRTRTADQIDLRTLELAGDVLVCECGRRFPIVDGVPIVLGDLGAYFHGDLTGILERDLPPEVAALLAEPGPDDQPYARLLEHLSIYLDAHWGDRAEPPPDGEAFGARAIVERIAQLPRVPRAVELGCSAGRAVAALAETADHVVGIDLQFGALRRARRLLDGERVPYARRLAGRHYAPASIAGLPVPAARRTLICADVLDPPLIPGHYDRVVALNVIDSVARPRQLLLVADGLCRPGGEVILSSPYAWQSSVVDEGERIGGADPAAAVAAILRDGAGIGGRYEIEEEADVAWTLRRDARSAVAYRVHYLRARKVGAARQES